MKTTNKPKVYVTRHLPQEAWDELVLSCQVKSWDEEFPPPYETMRSQLGDKEGLLCLLTDRIDTDLMDAAPHLKVISQCAVGYDNIDVHAAKERGIKVGNTPGVLTEATADFAFGLLMAAARRIGEGIEYVKDGNWITWGLTTLLGAQVYGRTLGIIGMGRIGQALAKRARGFDMRVIYFDTSRNRDIESSIDIEYLGFEELLRESDFISLHVNLTEKTYGLINARAFDLMKATAILINTSRGPVVDSDELYKALKEKKIAYAALDVTDPEPLPVDHKLLELTNLIVTPHIASATRSTRKQMAQMAVRNLIAGVKGEKLPFPV